MAPHVTPPPDAWPDAVRRELQQRAAALVTRWAPDGGPIVDLGCPGELAATLDAAGEPAFGGDAAVVVTAGALTGAADLHRALQGAAARLAPDGVLLAAEPVGFPAWRGVLVGSIGSLWPVARAAHLQRDVPFTVRRSGFDVLDLDRFALNTTCLPLRRGVALRARAVRPVPPNVETATQSSERLRGAVPDIEKGIR